MSKPARDRKRAARLTRRFWREAKVVMEPIIATEINEPVLLRYRLLLAEMRKELPPNYPGGRLNPR